MMAAKETRYGWQYVDRYAQFCCLSHTGVLTSIYNLHSSSGVRCHKRTQTLRPRWWLQLLRRPRW